MKNTEKKGIKHNFYTGGQFRKNDSIITGVTRKVNFLFHGNISSFIKVSGDVTCDS